MDENHAKHLINNLHPACSHGTRRLSDSSGCLGRQTRYSSITSRRLCVAFVLRGGKKKERGKDKKKSVSLGGTFLGQIYCLERKATKKRRTVLCVFVFVCVYVCFFIYILTSFYFYFFVSLLLYRSIFMVMNVSTHACPKYIHNTYIRDPNTHKKTLPST